MKTKITVMREVEGGRVRFFSLFDTVEEMKAELLSNESVKELTEPVPFAGGILSFEAVSRSGGRTKFFYRESDWGSANV